MPAVVALMLVTVAAFFVVRSLKPSEKSLFEAGSLALNEKDNQKAVDCFSQVIRLNPNRLDAFYYRAYAYTGLKEYSKALADFNEVIPQTMFQAEPFVGRGYAYIGLRNYDKARADFNIALSHNAKFSDAYLGLGDVYFQKRDWERAIEQYDEAIRLKARNAEVHDHRGAALVEKKSYDAAIRDFDEALRLDPKSVLALASRGDAYAKNKQLEKAFADFREAIRIDPRSPYGPNGMAWFLATCPDAKVRDGRKALEYANRACELSEWKDYWCLGGLAAAHAANNDFDAAVKWQKKALEFADGFTNYDEPDARERLRLYEQGKPFRDE